MKLFKVFLFGLVLSYSSLFGGSTSTTILISHSINNYSYGGTCESADLFFSSGYPRTQPLGILHCYNAGLSVPDGGFSSGCEGYSTYEGYICISYDTNIEYYTNMKYTLSFTCPTTCILPKVLNENTCSCQLPTCTPPEIWDTNTSTCIQPPEPCTTPNTDFDKLAENETAVSLWQTPDDFSAECIQVFEGSIQERTQECIKEYRCIKADLPTPDDKCKNQYINSYVSPSDSSFHEDIAIIGSDVDLHYSSNISSDDTIATGWSLTLHHSLNGNYLNLGYGSLTNIESKKEVIDGITTITYGASLFLFDADNKHVTTKDTYTKKTLYSFAYDSNAKLISITNDFNNITTIQRDANGVVTSITSPNGQVNYLLVDINNDLAKVTYEDNSAYIFVYENHLMISEKEPNSNEFLHIFDGNGKVTSVVDAESATWGFSKNITAEFEESIVNKAAGDSITYRDYFLNNDSLISEIISPSGDIFTQSTAIDGKSSSSLTKETIPSSITITQPSGLSSSTSYTQIYTYDIDDNNTLVKKQSIITSNGDTTEITRDYLLSNTTTISPEGRVSVVTYDETTLLPIKFQIANLKPTIYKYNEDATVAKIKQGARRVKYIYDNRGNVEKEINLQTKTTTIFEYDEKNRLTRTTYPTGETLEFAYDANGNRVRLTTPTPTDHIFEYNGVNKRTSYNSPLNYKTLYEYDEQRRVTKITRASGSEILNTYEAGQLKSLTTPEGITSYTYDCGSKVSSITNGAESTSYTYDGDLLTSQLNTGILNQSINYTYNNNFEVSNLEYAGNNSTYTYDRDGYLISTSEFNITRDATNALVTNISDEVLNLNLKYNKFGELKSQKSQNFKLTLKMKKARISYKSETVINHIQKKNRIKKQKTRYRYNYIYDNRQRLVSVSKNKQEVENYTYDTNGNRVKATVYGVTTTASYTLDDNLEVYGDNTYLYDEDGYLIKKTTPNGETLYTYNTLGVLTDVTLEDSTNIKYHQNALNQRVAKEVNGVITEKYLWQNLTTLLATYNPDNTLKQRYNYTTNRMPTSMTQDNQTYYLSYDQVGTLRLITDANHNIIKEVTYDTFGNILHDTNTNLQIPFGFAGGMHDRDTELVHFSYREYDPFTGKWTAKDPIGFDGGDANLYGYVSSDPVNFVDPTGEFGVPGAVAGAFVGVVSTMIDPCTGQVKFQGYKNLVINTLGGAAFGAIGASFSHLTTAGLIGGLGSSFLSGTTNFALASSCKKEPKCP